VALCLWLGDNGVALSMVKQAQHSNMQNLVGGQFWKNKPSLGFHGA
jgi:hypothetical protein